MGCAPDYSGATNVVHVVSSPTTATVGPLDGPRQYCAGLWTPFDLVFEVPAAPSGQLYSLGTVNGPVLSMFVDKTPDGSVNQYDEGLIGWYLDSLTFDP